MLQYNLDSNMSFSGKNGGPSNYGITYVFLTSTQLYFIFSIPNRSCYHLKILLIYAFIICSNNRLYYRLYFTQTVFVYHCLHSQQKTKWRTAVNIPVICQLDILFYSTVDPVTNDLASARQKKSLVTESRWSQE